MQDGMILALSGTNTVAVLTLIVNAWLKSRAQKIEQPIEIKPCPATTEKDKCDERHRMLNEQVVMLFARTELQGKEQAALAATQKAIGNQLASMDSKLDKLIARKG